MQFRVLSGVDFANSHVLACSRGCRVSSVPATSDTFPIRQHGLLHPAVELSQEHRERPSFLVADSYYMWSRYTLRYPSDSLSKSFCCASLLTLFESVFFPSCTSPPDSSFLRRISWLILESPPPLRFAILNKQLIQTPSDWCSP